MVASSFRYGVTITGAVLLVTGTLCFAWWSDGEMGAVASGGAQLVPPREAHAVASSSSSNALLRSVSFFCCGIGGILLLFGLLWSVKANARVVSRRYQYHFPRDLQYFTAEPLEKWNCSGWDASAIPSYEEALSCRPAPSAAAYVRPMPDAAAYVRPMPDAAAYMRPPPHKEEAAVSHSKQAAAPRCHSTRDHEDNNDDDDEEEATWRWQGGRRRSSSDGALCRAGAAWAGCGRPGEARATPPPSYEHISAGGL